MKERSRKNAARTVPLLMAASFIVLVAFCSQWVYSQYAREKDRLLGDLITVYEEAGRETMDSLLLRNVLHPLMMERKIPSPPSAPPLPPPHRDSMRIIVRRDLRFSTGKAPDSAIKKDRIERLSAGSKRARAFIIRDSLEERRLIAEGFADSTNAMLLKGVHLLVDRFGGPTTGLELFGSPAADSLLRRRFAALSDKKDWSFDAHFVTDDTEPVDENALVLGNAAPDAGPRLEIRGYKSYVFRQISPQFSFALLLVVLTGGAFLLSWKSLHRQMRLNAMKNDFISNMSHELKTPVATVKVALEAIDRFRVSEDAQRTKEYLEMARLEMDRLELLVQQSLNTAMLENGKLMVANEVVDAKEVVEGLAKTLQPKLEAASSQLVLHVEGAQFNIVADRLHLQGVLMNLLDNALKYGGEDVQIQMKIREENDAVIIEVEDNGPGIPAEYRSAVFDSYFRVPTGNRHNVKGYGLGLSYSRQAVERMGGSIRVEDCESKKGCRFIVRFPKATS